MFCKGADMRANSGFLPILGTLLIFSCSFWSSGCSAGIAFCGEDVKKLTTKDEVRESLGKPDQCVEADGGGSDEYHTHMKISEPTVAGVSFIMGVETFGLFELVGFPYVMCETVWRTLVGQDLQFVYGSDGQVVEIRLNGTRMEDRASLP
jgi:hypothetical protein